LKILITGAAGNLGTILAKSLLGRDNINLRLMFHRKSLSPELLIADKSEGVKADLGDPSTLGPAVQGIDQIIHFAGVLFRAQPERFLPRTNREYFQNLLVAAQEHGIRKVILISFPHVEGPTSFDSPARGRLDVHPISVHASTRLEEERLLFSTVPEPVSLRVGMVYGQGVLMIEAARWLAKRRLLGVWREPTCTHLISREDFCSACLAAMETKTAKGIYHVGDDGRQTLQEFLDEVCRHWGYAKPRRMPLGLIYAAARICELYSKLSGSVSPLTRDFIDIGRVSYYGDTSRFRSELVANLMFKTFRAGIQTL
jgi:nucleoside-diphosphate-sugar epimerase